MVVVVLGLGSGHAQLGGVLWLVSVALVGGAGCMLLAVARPCSKYVFNGSKISVPGSQSNTTHTIHPYTAVGSPV